MHESHAFGPKDIDLMHQGPFLTPDSQILTNCSLSMIYDKNSIHFPLKYSKQAQNDDFVS